MEEGNTNQAKTITFEEANKRTGLSEEALTKLCEDEVLGMSWEEEGEIGLALQSVETLIKVMERLARSESGLTIQDMETSDLKGLMNFFNTPVNWETQQH